MPGVADHSQVMKVAARARARARWLRSDRSRWQRWSNGRIDLKMRSWINGTRFGAAPGAEGMAHRWPPRAGHASRRRERPKAEGPGRASRDW